MPQHKAGDFQLAHSGGNVGKVIRFLQFLNGDGFGDYEHVRLYLGPDFKHPRLALPGYGWFAEAQPGGAVIAEHKLEGPGLLWSSGYINPTDAQRQGICTRAVEYVKLGTGYSYLDYAYLVASRLHIPVPGMRSYIASTGHMICSQFLTACYAAGGCPLYDTWTGNVTPGDLYQLLRARGAK